jgi:putative hemolysin
VVKFPALVGPVADRRAALAALPPLLRTYLSMGGWVSDHAVVDRALDTLHVFTCVEVDRVPPARAASLRAVVRGADQVETSA